MLDTSSYAADLQQMNEQSAHFADDRSSLRSPNELHALALDLSSALLASAGITLPKNTNPMLMNAKQAYLPTFDAGYSAGLRSINHTATLLDPSLSFDSVIPITDGSNINVSATMGSKGMMELSISIDPNLFGEMHIHLRTNKALLTACMVHVEKKPVFDRISRRSAHMMQILEEHGFVLKSNTVEYRQQLLGQPMLQTH